MIIFRGQSNYNLELNEWEPVRLKSTINKSFHKLMDEPSYSLGRAGEKDPKAGTKISLFIENSIFCKNCGRMCDPGIVKKLREYSKFHSILKKFKVK